MQAMPSAAHVQTPFVHWSAAYLLPQQPSQVSGGVPEHDDEDEDVEDDVNSEPQATARAPTNRAETIKDLMSVPWAMY
jgi:hypothetical protein